MCPTALRSKYTNLAFTWCFHLTVDVRGHCFTQTTADTMRNISPVADAPGGDKAGAGGKKKSTDGDEKRDDEKSGDVGKTCSCSMYQ